MAPSRAILRSLIPRARPNPSFAQQWRSIRPQTTYINPSTPPFKPRSRIRPYLWITLFTLSGAAFGRSLNTMITAYDTYDPDSPSGIKFEHALREQVDKISEIAAMLQDSGRWRELPIEPEEGNTMLKDTIRGPTRLVTCRTFWDEEESTLVNVVYLGGAMCGWPTMIHGGSSATILLESMTKALQSLQGVEAREPDHLALKYLKPMNATKLYLVSVKVSRVPSGEDDRGIDAVQLLEGDVPISSISGRASKRPVVGAAATVESLDGHVHMAAEGAWDVV